MLLYLLAVAIDEPAATPPQALAAPAPPHNYLRPSPCDKGSANEVVVCGDKDADKRYRLQPVDPRLYTDAPIRAETNVAGGVLEVAGKQMDVGGFPSNRIMLNFKIGF